MTKELVIVRPDDWHLHLRDEDFLPITVNESAKSFARAIIMPNLVPPITKLLDAENYKRRILSALEPNLSFDPLMTLYLTCLLYTSPSPRDGLLSRMPSSA